MPFNDIEKKRIDRIVGGSRNESLITRGLRSNCSTQSKDTMFGL